MLATLGSNTGNMLWSTPLGIAGVFQQNLKGACCLKTLKP